MTNKLNELEQQVANINKRDENKTNSSMNAAKKAKNDEFYTRIEDIEKEMKFYRKHFKNKIIFLNCDDPEWSNFYRYFYDQFNFLELKKLIATHYNQEGKPSYKIEITPSKTDDLPTIVKKDLKGNGDFRSEECIEILKESDIVITNPPFSLFREFIATLFEHKKKFLVLGDSKAVSYKEIFPAVKSNKMWIGKSGMGHKYYAPIKKGSIDLNDETTYEVKHMGFTAWWTNIGSPADKPHFPLWESYEEHKDKYKTVDNYDAIFIEKSKDMPYDYEGLMAVPVTFIGKINSEQFEIVGECGTSQDSFDELNNKNTYQKIKDGVPTGKPSPNRNPIYEVEKENATMYCPKRDMYFYRPIARLLIKNKKPGIEG